MSARIIACKLLRKKPSVDETKRAYRVYLCGGANCRPHSVPTLHHLLERCIWRHGLAQQVAVLVGTCQNRCGSAPNLVIFPGSYRYCMLTPATIERIVAEHLAQGTPIATLLEGQGAR